jgi:hypothetical protein
MRSRYVYSPDGKLVAEYKGSECVFYDASYYDSQNAGYMVMGDIQPYKSMIDGSVITSRSVHRSHLRQHGCVEVGNDSSVRNPKPQPLKPPSGLKEEIIRVANEKLRRI